MMRSELIDKIVFFLSAKDTDADIQDELYILMNDYEITRRETSIVVRDDEKNRMLLQKFIIAKTVSGRTDRTLRFYKMEIEKILGEINKSADEITPDDIRLYMAYRQKRDKVTNVTVNNELRCLRSFYGFLAAEGLVERNPCMKIEKIKEGKQKKEAFTEMDVERIRNACETAREKAVIELLLSTGCRVTELCLMKINDLKGDKIVVHGKGNKDRTVYLSAKAILATEEYLKERKDKNPYIFCGGYYDAIREHGYAKRGNIKEWYKNTENVAEGRPVTAGTIGIVVRKIGKRAGVEKTHPHRFRRTCATFALRKGMPIEQVSKMLGHEQIGTTQIYLDLSEEDLQRAHKKYVG